MLFLAAGEASQNMLMTMVTAIAAGIMLIFIARRTGLPAIVLLLLGGVALGPAGIGLVNPGVLGDGLRVIVALSVGLILFEGGLTLDVSGYRTAPIMIRRLLTFGVLVTWFGTATAIWLLHDVDYRFAIVAGSLVIVTGPTVIAPLLKRVKIQEKLHSVLHWEGVLIDPIGVFIAVLCFEWLSEQSGQGAILNLGIRLIAGLGIGMPGGWLLAYVIRRRVVPTEMINVFAVAMAVLIFGLAEAVLTEAGLLAVTAAGFVFGATGTARIKQVRQFKAELTDLLIGTLFILLAARLEMDQFQSFGIAGAVTVAIVMFVIRPLSIFLCSLGLDFTWSEKAFLSWIAPRGIVAASMASLFAIRLTELNEPNPRFVETMTYSVIIATIVLQGLSAGGLARLLGLKRPDPIGWMIVGVHEFSRRIARFIRDAAKVPVVLVDTNGRSVREAELEGLASIAGDARDTVLADHQFMQGVGHVLALTDNEDLNVRICQTWSHVLGEDHVFRMTPDAGVANDEDHGPAGGGRGVWGRLPRPTLLSNELLRSEATMSESGVVAGNSIPLITVDGQRVALDPKPDNLGDESHVLSLTRSADYLTRAVRTELITTVSAEDLRDLLGQLIDLVVKVEPALPRDETLQELAEREAVFPTVVGEGVAVPHAYSDALDTRWCAIARVPDGVDYSGTGTIVNLVFLLLSPSGDSEGHLATLADIARLVIEPETRKKLLEAGSAAAVLHAVRHNG